jgi:hypothetical protein
MDTTGHLHLISKFVICAGLLLAISPSYGQDKIVLKGGQIVEGKIQDVTNGNANLLSKNNVFPYPLANVVSVQMATPAELDKVRSGEPAQIVSTLEPLVKKFKGLPCDWVTEAMALVAEAYATEGKDTESTSIYSEMSKLYPGSRYQIRAEAGLAKSALRAGKYDDALAKITPLIAEANKSFSPSAEDGRLYGEAFLVQGQILEKQGKPKEALESYLTVVTVFYQNTATAKTARELADKLRKNNPQVVVD